MKLTLTRTYQGSDCTLGELRVVPPPGLDGIPPQPLVLQTIERPWIASPDGPGGMKGRSCVPKGLYRLECHNSEAHPRTWALVNPLLGVVHWDVDGGKFDRSVVLIHVANYASELRGCIAPGLKSYIDPAREVRMVTDSRKAMKALQTILTWSDDHEIEIQ